MSRFDLEQDIMGAWGTVEDLKLILENWDDLSEDECMNALLGVIELHNLRCLKLFKTFSESLKR